MSAEDSGGRTRSLAVSAMKALKNVFDCIRFSLTSDASILEVSWESNISKVNSKFCEEKLERQDKNNRRNCANEQGKE